MEANMSIGAALSAHKFHRVDENYVRRNHLRWGYIKGLLSVKAAKLFSRVTGIPTVTAELRAILFRVEGGQKVAIDLGVLSHLLVTDAGVAYVVDDWDGGANIIDNFNYHACGTGVGAEAVGDTALTESTTITDRATGTKSQPTANQMRTIGTQTFTGSGAITEHGIFSVVTESSGTLWDRSVFSAINVISGDSIQWTHTTTINSGG